ncbi:hypothetical protein AYL99_00794 [Fonsecaea erecta]|uniref:UBA domain-containing protein n=1 Tax=Fonsecaea erecta TaxID=1367422 RepID=A0A178ZYN2_9EURO|nr:hypothetical protein AYL99_00794 [Fonsecaea erecta]OAP64822.1 hypothetical protein AYL99_00794 [Fonsecaea erecta]
MVSVPTAMDITYCEGARLLQDSQADIDTILVQRPNGNLTCRHCYLVIADAGNLPTISSDKDWPLVVSCHVQACASLHDRRAAYSCYACLERGKTSIETSVAALKNHLQSCDLIKDVQPPTPYPPREPVREEQVRAPSVPERPKRRSRPAPAMEATPERPTARDPEMVQSPSSRRPVPSNSIWPGPAASPAVPNSPATPVKQTPSHGAMPAESERASQPRPKREVPTQAERTYTPVDVSRPEQPSGGPRAYADPSDVFATTLAIPSTKTFRPHRHRGAFSNDNYASPVRRKDINPEPSSQAPFPEPAREDRSFPTRPSRAPPAPPVLSAPAPPSSTSRADSAKIQQLASLGIGRARAEYLLHQTGGDVNEAAELGFSEQQQQQQHGSVGSGGSSSEWLPTPSSQAAQSEALPLSPGLERRNRRSK